MKVIQAMRTQDDDICDDIYEDGYSGDRKYEFFCELLVDFEKATSSCSGLSGDDANSAQKSVMVWSAGGTESDGSQYGGPLITEVLPEETFQSFHGYDEDEIGECYYKTAVTTQNTTGVKSIVGINPKEIFNQIIYSCKDIRPDAIKIGMLHSPEVIRMVLKALNVIKVKKIVLDPVMVAKGGAKLIDSKAIQLLKLKLIKKVSLITPNIPEAEILTKTTIITKEDMIFAANKLIGLGAKNVLIKGGHLKHKNVIDILINKKDIKIFKSERHKTKNTPGTGCTLSSSVTTFLSCGKTVKKSCELGIKYVNSAIKSNPKYGKGHGPINHLTSLKVNRKFK